MLESYLWSVIYGGKNLDNIRHLHKATFKECESKDWRNEENWEEKSYLGLKAHKWKNLKSLRKKISMEILSSLIEHKIKIE
jgi:hypothetical protein